MFPFPARGQRSKLPREGGHPGLPPGLSSRVALLPEHRRHWQPVQPQLEQKVEARMDNFYKMLTCVLFSMCDPLRSGLGGVYYPGPGGSATPPATGSLLQQTFNNVVSASCSAYRTLKRHPSNTSNPDNDYL